MARIASATVCPCETRTSTCRSLARASSGRCFLLAISVLLRLEAIPQGGPLRRGRITTDTRARSHHDEADLSADGPRQPATGFIPGGSGKSGGKLIPSPREGHPWRSLRGPA